MQPIIVYRMIMRHRIVFIERVQPEYYEPYNEYGLDTSEDNPFEGHQQLGGFFVAEVDSFSRTDTELLATCEMLYWTFENCCQVIRLLNQSDPAETIKSHSDFGLKRLLDSIKYFQTQIDWTIFQKHQPQSVWLGEIVNTEIAIRGGLDIQSSANFGYVYLIGSTDGHTKIGMSSDPERRIKELKPPTILPIDFNLIHRIETNDMRKLESRLHNKYASKRHKGEWYKLSEADIEAIKILKLVAV